MERMDIVRREADSPEARGVALSRRSFIEVAVGTLAALPVVNGGLALSFETEKAHAIETTVVTAKANEAAIVVMDMADNKQTPVAGARVVLKSSLLNKTIEGTTGDKGGVVFDITNLADYYGKLKKPPVYELYAEVEVTKDGYRIFRSGRTQVKGAHGIAVPTRKLEPGVPYPSRVTFDKWDVLYTDNEFCITDLNKADHTIRVDLENLPGSEPVMVTLFADEQEISTITAPVSNGSCTASFIEQFLLKTSKKVLVKDAKYWIRYIQAGQEFRTPIALKICTALGGFNMPGVERGFSLSPFSESRGSMGHKGVQISFPAGFPLIGGQTVPLPNLEFDNIDYGFDPYGYAYVSYKMMDFGYKSENGEVQKPDANGGNWQSHPKKTIAEQIDKLWDKHKTSWKDTMSAYGETSLFKPKTASFMTKFDVTLLAQVSLVAKWGAKENDLIRLRFGGQFGVLFNFSLSWQFIAVYIPIVVQFNTNASFVIGANIAASTPELTDFSKWEMDWVNTGALTYTIDISPSLSIGIGIMDCLTVSLKGVYTITIYAVNEGGWHPPDKPAKVESSHVVVGMAFSTSVVIQILFITIPFKLPWAWSEPQFYDSWRDDNNAKPQSLAAQAAEAEQVAQDLANMQFLDLVNEGLASGEAYALTDADFEDLAEDVYLEINYDTFNKEKEMEAKPSEPCVISGTDSATEALFYDEKSASQLQAHSVSGGDGDLTIGYSPDIKAQATAQDAGVASGSWGSSIMTYKDERKRRNFLFDSTAVVKAGVKRLGSKTGLVPNAVEVLENDAFGDPHTQVHKMFGRHFIFRLGIVSIKVSDSATEGTIGRMGAGISASTVCRSRVVCEGSFDGVNSYICTFDFNPWVFSGDTTKYVDRSEYDDYAYDLLVREKDSDTVELHFFIISGKRGNTTSSLAYLGSDQIMCYAVFEMKKSTMRAEIKDDLCYSAAARVNNKDVFDTAQGGTSFPYHHYSSPHITYLEDTVDGVSEGQSGLMFSYLDRAAKSQADILSQDPSKVRIGAGFYYYTPKHGCVTFSEADEINDTVFLYDLKDYSVHQMDVFPRCGTDIGKGVGWYIVMLKGEYTYYFLVEAGAMAAKRTRYGNAQYYASGCRRPKVIGVYDRVAEKDTIENGGLENWPLAAPAKLVPWPNHEGYLATFLGKLMHVKLTSLERPTLEEMGDEEFRVPEPRFTFTEVGPAKINVTSFGVDDEGQFLYYPSVREGTPGFRYDGSGEGTAKEDVEEHYVMACRQRNGKFCDPFVFCEVDYDMDTLVACGSQKSVAMSFISTNLVDPKKSKAELRFTGMPYVRCANVIGFSSIGDYAFPGVPSPFNVMIRNDGNVYLTGCSIRLHKRGAKDDKDDTLTKIVFSEDTLQESSFNQRKSDGTLDDVEPDYALAPGKTSIYSVMLMIPKSWEGKVDVSVTAQDFVAAGSAVTRPVKSKNAVANGDLSTMADEDSTDQNVGVDPDGPTDENNGSDDAALEFNEEFDGIDYDNYDDNIDYIAYADYVEPPEETDENGNVYVDYIVQPSDYDEDEFLEYPFDDIEVLYSEEVPGDELADAPVQDPSSEESGGNGQGSAGGSSAPTKPTSAKSTAAKTADSLGGVGGLLGVAAAAGAAMAAYSARRVANERAAAEGKASKDASIGGDGE